MAGESVSNSLHKNIMSTIGLPSHDLLVKHGLEDFVWYDWKIYVIIKNTEI